MPSIIPSTNESDLDAIKQRLAVIENLPAPENAAPVNIDDLKMRLNAIEQSLNAPSVSSGISKESAARLAAIEERLNAASEKQTQGASQIANTEASQSLANLSSKIEALQSNIETLSKERSILLSKLSALETKLGEAEKDLNEQRGASLTLNEVAQNVALDNLKRLALSGAPFGTALQTLKRAGFAPDKLDLIKPYADKGLVDTDTLKIKLNQLIGTALARKNPDSISEEAPKSAFEKLIKNARSVIKIRKVGNTNDSDHGVWNEMRTAFNEENVAAFKTAMNTLRAEEQTLFSNWFSDWQALTSLKNLKLDIEPKSQSAKQPQSNESSPPNSAQ